MTVSRNTGQQDEPEPLLTPTQVARLLNVSKRQVYYMTERGTLRRVAELGPHTFRFRPADIYPLVSGEPS